MIKKIDEFYKKHGGIVKSFLICILSMYISLLGFKLEMASIGIGYAILSALWFILWVLELKLELEEN